MRVSQDGHPVSEEPKAGDEPEVPLPEPPDGTAVNAAWTAEAGAPGGVRGLLYRLLERLLSPRVAAQRDFNAKQVQLDNVVLGYLATRFAATHRNYDRLLGLLGRRQDEIDERHRRLEEALVAHVRDLERRADVVLEESTRGRLAQEFALEDLRTRLARLEEALRRRGE
jgi:hypothetical protein